MCTKINKNRVSLLCLEKSDGTDPRLGNDGSLTAVPVVVGPVVPSPFPTPPTGAEPRRLVKICLTKPDDDNNISNNKIKINKY